MPTASSRPTIGRPPRVGMKTYDVLQNTNITGNLLATLPASFHGLDHILWDATLYPHMSANGKHPFYVLGKGLFFRISDLILVGGFHPWLTIEDPEIGMRLWVNGARLGVVNSPLVEEVPGTWVHGVTQRKRWVCGFFQTLGRPLRDMDMPWRKRIRARLNFVPCLSLIWNPIGFAVGIWALGRSLHPRSAGDRRLAADPRAGDIRADDGPDRRCDPAGMVLESVRCSGRAATAALRPQVNPVFVMIYWLWWSVSLVRGFVMYLGGGGLVWQRTEKVDANHALVRFGSARDKTAA